MNFNDKINEVAIFDFWGSKVKVKGHLNLISSRVHCNIYSYQATC